MTFMDLVTARQSVRHYKPEQHIPRETLERCLEAARLAPSACNSQPWSFVVVDHPKQVRELALAACTRPPYGMNKFAADASALVAVVIEKMKLAARIGAQFRGVQYSLVDVGIACEHLLLQATDEGLGSCWLGWFDERAVKRQLTIPRASKVDLLLCLGYPTDATVRPKTRRPLDAIRRYC
ncbi:MAG: nitroreductase family protein [Kiritimatiellia bacterium]|jgi:nitroreductase|nr:nitroreductase family protein [Kiritimatiellia bacterium]